MTLSISRKGLILVAVPLLFQIAFIVAVMLFQQDHARAEFWADHSKDVIAEANEIRTAVADIEASARGYVIARRPSFADDYRKAADSLPARFDALDRSVTDNPAQTDRAKAVRRAAKEVAGWQKGLVDLVEAENTAGAKERMESGGGEEFGRVFRREYDGFVAEERRLDRDRSGALARSRARLTALVGIGGVVIVAGTLALAVAFQRSIARRFAALESTARSLADGTPPAAPLAGDDEIAHLDRAFRDMAGELTRASEAFRDLYDHAPCGYHSVDPSGTLLAVNRTEARWLGYAVEELVGRMRFADFVAPASRDAYLAGFARVRESGSVSDVELDLVRRDGTTFPVLVGSSSVRDADGRYLRSRTTLIDLTERKRAEAATRLFADVTQNIPIGLLIYQLDEAGDPPVLRVRSGNAGASRLLGVALDEAAGRPVVEVFPAIPDDQLRRYTAVAADGGVDDLGEFRYGDGRVAERWWAVQAFALPNRSVGIAFQDVTDSRRARDEARRLNAELEGRVRERTAELARANATLREEEALFRGAFDNTNVAMVLTDLDNRFLRANAAFARLFGYSGPEVQALGLADITHPDHMTESLDRRAALLADGGDAFVIEKRYRHRDGRSLWGLTNVSLVRDAGGHPLRYVGQVQDITERKAAEQAVRERTAELEKARSAAIDAAARLRAIVETAVDGIITIDESGAIETVNPAVERLFGYPADQLIGRNVRSLMPEPFRGEHDGYLSRYLATGDRKVIGIGREVSGQRKDGSVFPLDLAVSETRLDGRRMFTGIVRDITARKSAEDGLRRAVADLEAANHELAQKNAENEMFVYSVSHDLRSPLVNLQGFSKELEKAARQLADILTEAGVPPDVGERCRGLLDGKMAKSVGFIQTAVLRLSGIIDALLRLSRAGRVEYRWEAVDVGRLVRQVVDAVQATVAEKGATVAVGELPPAWGDSQAVEQVFGNLIGNALTYLDPSRPGVVEVGAVPADGATGGHTYFVRDNGLGIADGHRTKIFHAFQRAHPGVGNGEGLGLAIVARVVERHRGRVWVESAPGVGSTFFVSLPAARGVGGGTRTMDRGT